MIRRRVVLLGCLLLVALTPAASAFVDPPVLVPEHPAASKAVSINIHFGACDGWIDRPGYPKITSNGTSIRVLLAATHASSASWCNVPIGTAHVLLGTFRPGSYVLQVDRTYQDFFGNEVVETLGTIEFTVAAAQPVMVPTLGAYGTILLLLGVAMLASAALCRHRALRA